MALYTVSHSSVLHTPVFTDAFAAEKMRFLPCEAL